MYYYCCCYFLCNILDVLNEDCMMNIFSYLPLIELVRSEKVSKRWKYLVEQKYKSFTDFDNNFIKCRDYDVIHRLLKKIGSNLKTLCINKLALIAYHNRYLKSTVISQFCPNLLELRIKNVHTTKWNRAMKNLRNLKVLEFAFCVNIVDETFEFCSDQLEEITINYSQECIGLSNLNVTNLKKLCIKNTRVRVDSFLKKLQEADKLKQLFLSNMNFGDRFIKEILKSLPNLTHLGFGSMSVCDSIYEISELKHLRHLELISMDSLRDDMIQSICQGCTQIVSLNIGYNRKFTDSCLNYIWSLKHLEKLDISGQAFTDASFMDIGRSGNGSKLRVLICRNIEHITNDAVFHVFLNCPQFEKIDLYNCPNIIYPTLIEQIVVISHTKDCRPNRYFVNLTEQFPVENGCSCLKISCVDSQSNNDSVNFDYTDVEFNYSSSD